MWLAGFHSSVSPLDCGLGVRFRKWFTLWGFWGDFQSYHIILAFCCAVFALSGDCFFCLSVLWTKDKEKNGKRGFFVLCGFLFVSIYF